MSEMKNSAIVGDVSSGIKEKKAFQMGGGGRFYAKLAWMGIRKNKRFYLPYILTCVAMVAIYYIISYLTTCPLLASIAGGEIMSGILMLGCGVICVFSVVFLFYTNSFLTKRRKKEFGLYNILGMGKRSLAWILCWETVIIGILAIGLGIFFGIVFSKLAELVMANLLFVESDFTLSVSIGAVQDTVKQYIIIFILLLGNMLYQVWKSNPMELLHSEQAGEKPPKVNWLHALVGAVTLAGAYYLAVSIENPIQAILIFFVAVIMVIMATYLLFISGSVALCRLLQKNKRYYYKANHFVSVSSMGYRMKRNGASLASICILCTMVLVMLMSTGCLYMGMEGSLRERYPRNVMFDIEASSNEVRISETEYANEVRTLVKESAKENGVAVNNPLDYSVVVFTGYAMVEGTDLPGFYLYQEGAYDINATWQMFVLSLDDYNRLAGTKETLEHDEALCYVTKTAYPYDTITLGDEEQARTWKIKKQVDKFVENGVDSMQIMPSMFLVVPDMWETLSPWLTVVKDNGYMLMQTHWYYGVDLDCEDDKQQSVRVDMEERLYALTERAASETEGAVVETEGAAAEAEGAVVETEGTAAEAEGAVAEIEGVASEAEGMMGNVAEDPMGGAVTYSYRCECVAAERTGYYELYGGLFFLGIMLGLVFILAAVLMMYYKQISEGYEDQGRFEIMQKVGMTAKQIKKSINSQVLTVFFLPLFVAVLHLIFAFPLVYKMLLLMGFANQALLITVTGACVLIFAVFYILVYHVTSKAYYSIVSVTFHE